LYPVGQVGVGADVLLSRTRPVGLRWEAGYELIAAARPGRDNGRVAIGLIFGPHLQETAEERHRK
jgi:hypothetical protein